MDITLESILKTARMESKLDSTGKGRKNYINLLNALQPYGYAVEEFKSLYKYMIDTEYLDIYDCYYDFEDYRIDIYPSYMYRVDGYFCSVEIFSVYGMLMKFNITNTDEELFFKRIKNNELNKDDMVEMSKVVYDFLNIEYPGIKINGITINGYDTSYNYKTLAELEADNISFKNYKSVLNGDS